MFGPNKKQPKSTFLTEWDVLLTWDTEPTPPGPRPPRLQARNAPATTLVLPCLLVNN